MVFPAGIYCFQEYFSILRDNKWNDVDIPANGNNKYLLGPTRTFLDLN